jgi:hypothetical protein
MSRIVTKPRLAATAVAGGMTALIALSGAPAASAAVSNTVPLAPGQAFCVSQDASFQVRAEGSATGGGARFKLLRNGQVLEATPGRVNWWAAERRTSYGNFPGPGSYAACAYNTGTTNTTVYLSIRTDYEI